MQYTLDTHRSVDTAKVVERSCLRKRRLGRRAAMEIAQRKRARGIAVTAYRCPFADDERGHWHLGHAPAMHALEDIAYAIRDAHGNAPSERKGK